MVEYDNKYLDNYTTLSNHHKDSKFFMKDKHNAISEMCNDCEAGGITFQDGSYTVRKNNILKDVPVGHAEYGKIKTILKSEVDCEAFKYNWLNLENKIWKEGEEKTGKNYVANDANPNLKNGNGYQSLDKWDNLEELESGGNNKFRFNGTTYHSGAGTHGGCNDPGIFNWYVDS